MPNLIRYFVILVNLLFAGLHVAAEAKAADGYVLDVPLPLTASDSEVLAGELRAIAKRGAVQRPTVVLRFESQSGLGDGQPMGATTTFESALALARMLTSVDGNRIRSVAFISESIEGHACLVALACEEIAIASTAEFGGAGVNERQLDATVRNAYADTAEQRGLVPIAAVNAMLDDQAQLFRVGEVEGNVRFVNRNELTTLEDEGKVTTQDQLTLPGSLARFDGRQLRQLRWVTYLADSLDDLQETLQLASFVTQPTMDDEIPRQPALLELRGYIDAGRANQFLRTLDSELQKANLLLIDFKSIGGDFRACLRVAQRLADLGDDILVVGILTGDVAGGASVIPMVCDRVFATKNSSLGGVGDGTLTTDELKEFLETFDLLAAKANVDDGKLYGPLATETEVVYVQDAKQATEWTARFRIDNEAWQVIKKLPNDQSLSADWLLSNNWINEEVIGIEEAAAKLGIAAEDIPEPVRETFIEGWVRKIAGTPGLSFGLLMMAFVMFMSEMSAPGVGVPGFISALCLLGFFWIQYFNGTVEWLEILMFAAGIVFLGVEFFVIPGFGLFGIAGLLMMITSIVLACQTFVFPSNSLELHQLTLNIWKPTGALLGIGVGLFLIRNHLEQLPFFRMFALAKLTNVELNEMSERENIVHYNHLMGQSGTTVTRCNPAGKARIAGQLVDVLSDGQLLADGVAISVCEVRGNRVIVTPQAVVD
jgi:membrane-bound ClpP family serine protease